MASYNFDIWRPPSTFAKTELTVVVCTNHYYGKDFVKPFTLPDAWGTSISCNFTDDLSLARNADALWFHGPSTVHVPKSRRRGQKFILNSMESPENDPVQRSPELLEHFDLLMTYRLDSDIPTTYFKRWIYDDFSTPPLPTSQKSRNNALAVYIASNPVPFRDSYVRELMNYVSVDCPGRCLNNIHIPEVSGGAYEANGTIPTALLEFLSTYKFCLAFENSSCEDYVTEKILRALSVGVVPVYYGAKNIREFLPMDNAAINVTDFESPKALADYLLYLDENDDAYEAHLEWKSTGYSKDFRRLLDLGDVRAIHRMAIKLAHGGDRACPCGGRLR